MKRNERVRIVALTACGVGLLLAAACAPAAPPNPTAAPVKATEAPKPALSKAEGPAAQPTTAAAKPTEAPAVKPAASPAAKPATTASARPALTDAQRKGVEDFYKDKTVKIVVGGTAGGGFDTYSRVLARHMPRHIPGKPNIVVENLAGAGSLIAANTVYNSGPKDGATFVIFIGTTILQQLLGNDALQFDAAKFNYLGAATTETPACAVMSSNGFNSLQEATGSRQLVLGGLSPGASTDDIPNMLRNMLGLNLKVVSGYGGTSAIRLAAERGEVMGGCWGWESIKVTWKDGLEKGEVKVIAQGDAKPHSDLPRVPLIRDLAKTDEQRQLIDVAITLTPIYNRPYALPPGVPSERVQAMRQALLDTLRDPEFLAEADKAKLDINPVTGEQIEQAVKQVLSLPPELRPKLKQALTP